MGSSYVMLECLTSGQVHKWLHFMRVGLRAGRFADVKLRADKFV